MSHVYTDQGAANRYDAARSLPQETSVLWMETLRSLLPPAPVQRVLDLGAGTGRFSEPLRTAFQCPVIAVDPSEAMLDQGRSRGLDNVTWQHGAAESIPLDANSIDLVWMCQVLHHLMDPQAAVREIYRVLAPGGHLAIRNGTRENESEIEWGRCFPEAQQIDQERLPWQRDIVDLACGHGFETIAVKTVYQFFASSYAEYYEKIRQRGLSALIAISDEAFAAGLERLKQWIAARPVDGPVYEPVDLFVFRVLKEEDVHAAPFG